MNILRPKNKKPFSVKHLTVSQKKRIQNCKDMECGLGGWISKNIFRIPNLWMKSDCKLHDISTRRGGMLLDWVDNATGFFKVLFEDLNNIYKNIIKVSINYPLVNFLVVCILASFGYVVGFAIILLYWICATIGTIFVFSWGEYKDFNTIMREAKKNYKENN